MYPEYATIIMLVLTLIVFPAVMIMLSNRNTKKFIASYPPKYQALAKQASDEMWPRGVLDNIIAIRGGK